MSCDSQIKRDFLTERPAADAVMRLATDARCVRPLPCAVAIGAFDGVHRGHCDLIERMAEDAAARGVAPVIVTFDPDPDQVLSAAPAPKLMSFDDRIRALATLARVLVVPFTRELAALDHVAFFDQVLGPVLDIRAVHVGADFRLGARGASTVEVIRAWAADRGIRVFGHELLRDGEDAITATRIRTLLGQGDIPAAARELGRRPMLRGTVVHGRGQGTGMGFPTANIDVPDGMQLPSDGVYAALALADGRLWPAAVNVGVPPMFADAGAVSRVEAHLLGYRGDLYGSELSVAFERRLRPSTAFGSRDELIATVHADIAHVEQLLGSVILGCDGKGVRP